MLPSRPRLRSWNPDSLAAAGSAVGVGGEYVYHAVRRLDDECDRLPEARAWQGHAHDAATKMFDRATHQASPIQTSAEAMAAALQNGSGSIGATRRALLNKADEVDQGELHVTDDWVVLIKPAQMSAEKAASLQKQAEAEQAEINRLLLAVGDADDETAAAVQAAAKDNGFELGDPNSLGGLVGAVEPQPVDEVPDPRTPAGMMRQASIRGEDMGITVRQRSESTDRDGNRITTLTMQDGSKQVITVYNPYPPGKNPVSDNLVEVTHFDNHGGFVSQTQTQRSENGTETTNIIWANGTQFIATQTADGKRTAAFTLPDGRHGVLPPNNPIFQGAVPKVLGGGLTALDAHAERGGKIPMLTPESVENVGKTARFAGPALGILATIYDVGAAETAHEACVAGVSGAFGVVGDYVGGGAGATVGGAIPGAEAFTVPLLAVAGATGGAAGLGWIGSKVGEAFCPR